MAVGHHARPSIGRPHGERPVLAPSRTVPHGGVRQGRRRRNKHQGPEGAGTAHLVHIKACDQRRWAARWPLRANGEIQTPRGPRQDLPSRDPRPANGAAPGPGGRNGQQVTPGTELCTVIRNTPRRSSPHRGGQDPLSRTIKARPGRSASRKESVTGREASSTNQSSKGATLHPQITSSRTIAVRS